MGERTPRNDTLVQLQKSFYRSLSFSNRFKMEFTTVSKERLNTY